MLFHEHETAIRGRKEKLSSKIFARSSLPIIILSTYIVARLGSDGSRIDLDEDRDQGRLTSIFILTIFGKV